jgi:hypothetical protein
MPSDRQWVTSLPSQLGRQREAITALLEYCEGAPLAASLSVGCSLGRGAADALSDVDAAIGVQAPSEDAGGAAVRSVEREVVEVLPGIGGVVDTFRQETVQGGHVIRRLFAQFADRLQLDVAVVPEDAVRRGDAAPDFVPVYWASSRPHDTNGPSAFRVSETQLQEWSFLGWRALLDADKYLRRGSPWEAHARLHEARDRIWMLWAAARGASYPWHGLSQVLDHDPALLPPGVEATVTGLDAEALRRALTAAVDVLARTTADAARACDARINEAMADYVRRTVISQR